MRSELTFQTIITAYGLTEATVNSTLWRAEPSWTGPPPIGEPDPNTTAYVLDERKEFAARCNMGMVGFEALGEEDVAELRGLIAEHEQRTGSPVAARVLAQLEQLLAGGQFVKVMPHDYKRVLGERAQAAEREQALAGAAAGNGGIALRQPLDAVGERAGTQAQGWTGPSGRGG